MEIEEDIQRLVDTFDGTIVQDCQSEPKANVNLDQGTLDDEIGQSVVVRRPKSNQMGSRKGTDYTELLSQEEPAGPHHVVVVTKMHDEFEAVMVAKDEAFKKAKKQKTGKREQKEMTPENRERSIRRSKKKIRHLSMMMKADKLGTLTTALPIKDVEEFKELVSRFLKYVRNHNKRTGFKFQYVLVFEKHD